LKYTKELIGLINIGIVIMMNKYLVVAFILVLIFIILSAIVSPKLNLANHHNLLSPIVKYDNSLLKQMIKSHMQWLNQFMIFMTQYGREAVLPIFIILIAAFGGQEGRKTAAVMSLSILVLIPISMIVKDIVARPRPDQQISSLLPSDNEYSFPSGHATIVSAGAATALVLFRTKNRIIISIALAAEAAIVCISRVYLGHHFPLDVVGGVLLGVGVSFMLVGVSDKIEKAMLMLTRKLSIKP
jgi:undecaprenyl-diphosphatase